MLSCFAIDMVYLDFKDNQCFPCITKGYRDWVLQLIYLPKGWQENSTRKRLVDSHILLRYHRRQQHKLTLGTGTVYRSVASKLKTSRKLVLNVKH